MKDIMSARAVLTCRPNSHPFQDRSFFLEQPFKIGRSVARSRPAGNNAIFDCKVLSRNHALLWYENGKFFLQDTKSSNGTFVNNQRLSKSSEESLPFQVSSGDILQFGVDVMEVTKKDPTNSESVIDAVTHGCIVATLQLYLPDGKEAKASSSTQIVEKNQSSTMEMYQINQVVKEALQREQMIDTKLESISKLLGSTKTMMASSWKALINEDRLLCKVDSLQRQLQASHKSVSEDKLREEIFQLHEDKEKYQTLAKQKLKELSFEKLESVKKLQELERNLTVAEEERTMLKDICDRTNLELSLVAQKYDDAEKKSGELLTQLGQCTESYKSEIEKLNQCKREDQELIQRKQTMIDTLLAKLDTYNSTPGSIKGLLVGLNNSTSAVDNENYENLIGNNNLTPQHNNNSQLLAHNNNSSIASDDSSPNNSAMNSILIGDSNHININSNSGSGSGGGGVSPPMKLELTPVRAITTTTSDEGLEDKSVESERTNEHTWIITDRQDKKEQVLTGGGQQPPGGLDLQLLNKNLTELLSVCEEFRKLPIDNNYSEAIVQLISKLSKDIYQIKNLTTTTSGNTTTTTTALVHDHHHHQNLDELNTSSNNNKKALELNRAGSDEQKDGDDDDEEMKIIKNEKDENSSGSRSNSISSTTTSIFDDHDDETIKKILAESREQVNKLQVEKAALQERVESLGAYLTEYTRKYDIYKAEAESLEQTNAEQKGQLSALTEKFRSSEKLCLEFQADLKSNCEVLSAQEKTILQLKDELSALQEYKTEQDERVVLLRSQINDLSQSTPSSSSSTTTNSANLVETTPSTPPKDISRTNVIDSTLSPFTPDRQSISANANSTSTPHSYRCNQCLASPALKTLYKLHDVSDLNSSTTSSTTNTSSLDNSNSTNSSSSNSNSSGLLEDVERLCANCFDSRIESQNQMLRAQVNMIKAKLMETEEELGIYKDQYNQSYTNCSRLEQQLIEQKASVNNVQLISIKFVVPVLILILAILIVFHPSS